MVRRADGLADQRHVRLHRRAAALAAVATHAAAHQVLPAGAAALAARHDVVEAQLAGGKAFAAVLAAVVVAGKDVAAVELGFATRHAVVFEQPDDPRHGEVEAHGADPLVVGVAAVALGVPGPGEADALPVGEVVAAVAAVVDLDDLGEVAGDHGEGAPRVDHTHRDPELVEHQDVAIECRRGWGRSGHQKRSPREHGSRHQMYTPGRFAGGCREAGGRQPSPPRGTNRARARRGLSTRPPPPATFSGPGECQSGQLGRAVNPLAYAYAGSNPASPTATHPRRGLSTEPATRVFCCAGRAGLAGGGGGEHQHARQPLVVAQHVGVGEARVAGQGQDFVFVRGGVLEQRDPAGA